MTADFDGDGRIDSASVGYARPRRGCPSDPPAKPEYGIGVRWGSGASGAWGLPECASSCVAYASADLDGNGTDEFALMVDDGAATQFIDILELPVSEAGPTLFEVAPPGTAGHPAHRPLRLATGGSVTHLDFVTCDAASGRELIATSAVLSSDQTTWSLHETVFDMELSARTSRVAIGSAFAVIDAAEAFFVVSDRDYSESADPGGRAPTVRGHPCFEAA